MTEVIDSHSAARKMRCVFPCQNPILPGRLPPWRQRPLRVHFAALQSYASYAHCKLLLTAFDLLRIRRPFSIFALASVYTPPSFSFNRKISNTL